MKEIVSVIIPAYNCEKTIQMTVNSIKSSSYKDIEIIVINDGSTDNTKEVLEKIKGIKVFNNENHGVSYTRNYGIEKAIGNYIMFVDADDIIDCDFIDKLVAKKNKKNTLLGGLVCIYSENGNKEIINQKKKYEKKDFIFDLVTGNIDGFCVRYLFEKKNLQNIRFDTRLKYMEDTVLLLNLLVNSSIENIEFINTNYNYMFNNYSVSNKKDNSINRLHYIIETINCIYNMDLQNILDCDLEVLIENRKAKLFESQIYLIQSKKNFKKLKSDKIIYEELIKLQKNKKTKKIWKIYYKIILNISYPLFKLYKILRKVAKKYVQGKYSFNNNSSL